MNHEIRDVWLFEFSVDRAAIRPKGSPSHFLTTDPLYVVNKANLGDRDRRAGSERWQELLAFEAAVHLSAHGALRAQGLEDWPTDARGYSVDIKIEFGDRLVVVDGRKANARRRRKGIPSRPRKPHTRRDRAESRARAYGVDSIKAILDALQGVVYDADEQAESSSSRKVAREGEIVGDRLTISVRLENGTDAPHRDRPHSANPTARR